MNLNLLKTFVKVAEMGSFTKAAAQLKQPKSRVSRSIARLEEEAGVELIKRSTRSIALTDAGIHLFKETRDTLRDLENKFEAISQNENQLSGTLSISAPIDMGEDVLPALLCEFSMLYPLLDYKVFLSDSYVDLHALNIDVAIRAGNLIDSTLKQKKLAIAQLILVASEDYFQRRGFPKRLQDLKNHDVIAFFNENQLDPLSDLYQKHEVRPTFRLNSFPMIKKMVMEGKGIGVLPNLMCRSELKAGNMRQVLQSWCYQKSNVQVVYTNTKNLPLKVRRFIDFLSERKDFFSDSY